MKMCDRCFDRAQRELRLHDFSDGTEEIWHICDNCYLELIKFIEGENKGCLKKQKRRTYRQGEDNEK